MAEQQHQPQQQQELQKQPKVTLHWLNRSRSQSLLWLLEELKIQYDLKIYYRNKATFLAPPELEKIHPLGKSPVIAITPVAGEDEQPQQPIVLAESGHIMQYLCEHFPEGKRLVPQKWKPGREGQVGGETEAWLRNQYFLHYSEGSLMPIMVMSLMISRMKEPPVPFFIRPITTVVANRIFSTFIFPNARRHLQFLEQQLQTSSGKYICGDHLTTADIILSFPLIAGKQRFDIMGPWEGGSWSAEFPRLAEYVGMLEAEPGYKKGVEKIKEIEGAVAPKPNLA